MISFRFFFLTKFVYYFNRKWTFFQSKLNKTSPTDRLKNRLSRHKKTTMHIIKISLWNTILQNGLQSLTQNQTECLPKNLTHVSLRSNFEHGG